MSGERIFIGLSESLDMLEKLGSCIGQKGPFTVILSTPTFKDEPSEVVDKNGDNVITLGGKGKVITAKEICLKLSNLVLQSDYHSTLFYEGIQKVNNTTFMFMWGT